MVIKLLQTVRVLKLLFCKALYLMILTLLPLHSYFLPVFFGFHSSSLTSFLCVFNTYLLILTSPHYTLLHLRVCFLTHHALSYVLPFPTTHRSNSFFEDKTWFPSFLYIHCSPLTPVLGFK